MHTTSLESFKKEINQVREYFKHIQYVNNLVDYTGLQTNNEQIESSLSTLTEHHRSFGTDKKIFEYKASIISLYGLLEKYVEIWIKEYLDSLSSLVSEYKEIDEKIRNNHFELSLKLINTIVSRESAKYQHLTKEEVLEKLNKCIVNPISYKFNTEAFVLSSGNLKHKQIVKLFELINVSLNDALKKNQTLIQYIKNEKQIKNIPNLDTDTLYNTINDLVERRNQIAHGSEVLDILSISGLEPYIQFLEKYCQALLEILVEEFIKKESISTFKKIEKVIKIFSNKVLAFEIENYTIKVEDMLIIETAEGNFYKKPILTIQLNNDSYTELRITEKANISISVDTKIKENQTFYIVKQ
ncbi:MAE_28990/MAE_18760 family HEPN-like nuclease [Nostoc sp. CALU 1950]|uniref:MAE_28990/MAE_18760 family HEPN-like nuclease n=1 Tax=Nostoc sp. CALU 1950 TaxID=3104321 RepID=UPI003EBFFAFB